MSELYFTLPSDAKVEALVARAELARRDAVRAVFVQGFSMGMRKIANGFRLFEQSLIAAREARWLYEMGDAELARRGLDRQQIPALISGYLDEAVPRRSILSRRRVTANDDRQTANSNVGDIGGADARRRVA